jgi:hypothetical protein
MGFRFFTPEKTDTTDETQYYHDDYYREDYLQVCQEYTNRLQSETPVEPWSLYARQSSVMTV